MLFPREQLAVGSSDLAVSLRASVFLRAFVRTAVWAFGCSSASPRSPREKRLLAISLVPAPLNCIPLIVISSHTAISCYIATHI